MIINLIGPIAVGKSSFARWFVDKYPEWKHLPLDKFREIACNSYRYNSKATPSQIEDYAIQLLCDTINKNQKYIIESTGYTHDMNKVWQLQFINNKIYTVYLDASLIECQKRAKKRNRKMLAPYNASEYTEILENYKHQRTPSNLYVNLTKANNLNKIYEEIEWYIIKAETLFNAQTIGNNQII